MRFRFKNRREPVDVPRLLERLGIRAQKIAPTKWQARCPHPEHEDRTPSWFIRDNAGGDYHGTHCCKSCGFEGGTLSLVEGVLGLEREAAIEWLNELRGPIRHPLRVEVIVRESIFVQTRICKEPVFEGDSRMLTPADDWPVEAVEYCDSRGLKNAQIVRWNICVIDQHVKEQHPTQNRLRPHRLRERIYIPYHDNLGRLRSYVARDYTGFAEKRYLMPSKEDRPSPLAIFGELFWEGKNTIVICEGAFDALAAERVLPDGVAIGAFSGSNPLPEQLAKLRIFRRVIVATDNDPAGNRAAKDIRLHLGAHVEIVRACPPKDTDLNAMPEDDRREFFGGIIGT